MTPAAGPVSPASTTAAVAGSQRGACQLLTHKLPPIRVVATLQPACRPDPGRHHDAAEARGAPGSQPPLQLYSCGDWAAVEVWWRSWRRVRAWGCTSPPARGMPRLSSCCSSAGRMPSLPARSPWLLARSVDARLTATQAATSPRPPPATACLPATAAPDCAHKRERKRGKREREVIEYERWEKRQTSTRRKRDSATQASNKQLAS